MQPKPQFSIWQEAGSEIRNVVKFKQLLVKQVKVNILEENDEQKHGRSESHHFISNVSVIQKNQRRRRFCCTAPEKAGNTEAKATPLIMMIIIIIIIIS